MDKINLDEIKVLELEATVKGKAQKIDCFEAASEYEQLRAKELEKSKVILMKKDAELIRKVCKLDKSVGMSQLSSLMNAINKKIEDWVTAKNV